MSTLIIFLVSVLVNVCPKSNIYLSSNRKLYDLIRHPGLDEGRRFPAKSLRSGGSKINCLKHSFIQIYRVSQKKLGLVFRGHFRGLNGLKSKS